MSFFFRCTDIRKIILVALTKAIITCIVFISLGCVSVKYFNVFFSLQEASFSNAYIAQEAIGQTNYADVSIYYDLQTGAGKNIDSVVLMDATYDNTCPVFRDVNKRTWLLPLEKNQVAVSRTVSRTYKLQTGSVIYAELPYQNIIMEYSVFAIIDDYFVLDGFNNPQKLIIIGNDRAFYDYSNGLSYVSFVDDFHNGDVIKNALVIKDAINKQNHLSTVLLYGFGYLILAICVILGVYLLFHFFAETPFRKTFSILNRYGLNNKALNGIILISTLIIITIPLLLGAVGMLLHCINYGCKEVASIMSFFAGFIIIVTQIFYFIAKRKTRKWRETK